MAFAALFESLVGVGRRRPGDGVGIFGIFRFLVLFLARLVAPVQVEFVPRHLTLTHPKGGDADGMLRPLVVLAVLLAGWTAHEKFAARNGNHVELDRGAGDSLGV